MSARAQLAEAQRRITALEEQLREKETIIFSLRRELAQQVTRISNKDPYPNDVRFKGGNVE